MSNNRVIYASINRNSEIMLETSIIAADGAAVAAACAGVPEIAGTADMPGWVQVVQKHRMWCQLR